MEIRKEQSELIEVRAVARALQCSTRHVRRMVLDGRIIPPVRLGRLVRWRRAALEKWLAEGCPATGKGDAR